MTDDTHGDVFPGARRAAAYVEPEVTDIVDVRAPGPRRTPQLVDVDDMPAPAIDHAPSAPAEPIEAAPAAAPAEAAPTGIPESIFLDPVADLSTASTLQAPVVASSGFRGWLNSLGFKLAPGAREQQLIDAADTFRQDQTIIRQATWTRAVSILVANKKGGAGKTPTALLIGGVLAAARGGSVCVLEVSDDPGALTFRAEGSPTIGLGELVGDVDQISSAGQLAGYTAPQTSFASVIGTVGRRPQLTRESVVDVSRVIDEYFTIRVMDSGNQPSSTAFDGAAETADALVIPVLNAGDAVLEAVATIDELRARGGRYATLADNAVVIRLTDGRPEHPEVVARVDQIIESMHVGAVYQVPYDPHIAERGQLTLSRLSPPTQVAFTAAAAGVIQSLKATVR